ncbi:Sulfur carrier protein ThiS adenylyltransferase [Pseudodesulfovibrio hydrargyri]|uniref:Sulfur carrier protein ThiS adenylyltransferase n=1 Tax=Pseudodesulfovibrio hydrargyri TaxID=2125990 RepID=A0A1J5NBQ3_9BACT|nr:ThiF family adenylyltransferase [Pseudodesulfovibrio hydrargyri]OIQ49161.1 Sulfur carrier protein ThiS adenylyltransferase [Pseudodesulfovibrio hydrargyri]
MAGTDQAAALRAIAAEWGLRDIYAYNEEAFSRTIGFLDAADMDRLINARVAVPGLGGVGGVHVVTLARLGVGKFHLSDMDSFEPANMNRQFGARVQHFGKSKLDVMAGEALSVNPYIEVATFPEGLNADNMDAFLRGVDVVVDGLDFFVFDVRRMLFNRARELGIPVITAGPLGFSSALLVFTPDGMSFDEYFDITDGMEETRKYLHFAMGLAPRATHARYMDASVVDFDLGKGPSTIIGCQMCSALAATEVVRLLLGRKGVRSAPYYVQIDPYLRKIRRGRLRKGNKSRAQRLKAWLFENVMLKRAKRVGCEPMAAPKLPAEGESLRPVHDYLLKAGVQAPSGDNVQPWRFQVGDHGVEVRMDLAADDSFFNVGNLATAIASGAAVENIAIAARACGLTPAVAMGPTPDRPDLAASIGLERAQLPREDILVDALWRRHTNRKPYRKRQIPAGMFNRFGAVASEAGGNLGWINTPEQLNKLADAIFLADRIRMERRDLHEHLVRMVRFTPQAAEATRDGLPLKNLEAGLGGELFLRATKSWKTMRAANIFGASRVGAGIAAKGIRHSGGAGLLTVPGTGIADFLQGGRALQRVWLTLTHYNLRMQPMTAVTLFRLRWLLEGPDTFSPKHRDMLSSVWASLAELFPKVWAQGPVMLFRAGFGKPIHFGTYRRPVESFRI